MALADRNRELCAVMAYCEASSGTPEERRLVIHTAFNRVKLPKRYEPTVAGVVEQRAQYSEFLSDLADNRNLERGLNAPDSDPVMQDCYAAYDEVFAGAPDGSGGAVNYEDSKMTPSPWTVGARMTLETEHFKFYADVK